MTTATTDAQLLAQFARRADPAAFRELVRRHGPAVQRVCRWLLRDPHEADDAFQATFLVLVRRAPEVSDPDALGAWLRGVAYKVASQARRRASLRRRREADGLAVDPASADEDRALPELRALLRDELGRLPEAYRAPLVLCYLEGLTHEQASEQLGWPLGTVKVRLVRGRKLLRSRLERRKVALGLAALLLLLRSNQASAVEPTLVDATVGAMTREAGRGSAPPRPAWWPIRVVRPPGTPRRLGGTLRLWAALLALAFGLAAGGVALAARHAAAVAAEEDLDLPASLTDVLNVLCR